VVIGWFTRFIVVMAVLGIVGFDTITLTASHVGAHEDAVNAASTAASAWQSTSTQAGAFTAAEHDAESRLTVDESLVPGSFHIAANGTVTLTITRITEHTIVAHDIGWMRHLVTFRSTASAAPASS
jgi:hypothetical protein